MKRAPLATVTIKLSVWGDVQDLSVYQAIIKDFEASQNEIKVIPEQWTGDYYAKLQTVMAAGTVPDVVYFQPWTWQPFAISNTLRPLDDFIKRDQAHIPNVWAPSYASSTRWNGKIYMAPADSNPMVMFYVKEMFDKAHVPYPKEGWSVDDFVQTAKELTVSKGGKVVQYGYQPNYGDPYFRNQGWMRLGGHLESYPLIKPKKANFADPLVTKYLQQQFGDLAKMGAAIPAGALLAGGGQYGYYSYGIQNGLVAMKIEGPWFMPQMTGPIAVKKGGLAFDVVSAPRQGTQWHAPSGVSGHTIVAQSKNAEAGWELIKFIIGDQGQRRVAEGGRTCSRADAIQKLWFPIASKLYGFKNYEPWAKTVGAADMIETGGVTSNQILLQGGFQAAVDSVANGSQTAAQAFAPVNPKVQALYDAWWRAHPNG
jgi:multiple sugar transport system substrate-binding protein